MRWAVKTMKSMNSALGRQMDTLKTGFEKKFEDVNENMKALWLNTTKAIQTESTAIVAMINSVQKNLCSLQKNVGSQGDNVGMLVEHAVRSTLTTGYSTSEHFSKPTTWKSLGDIARAACRRWDPSSNTVTDGSEVQIAGIVDKLLQVVVEEMPAFLQDISDRLQGCDTENPFVVGGNIPGDILARMHRYSSARLPSAGKESELRAFNRVFSHFCRNKKAKVTDPASRAEMLREDSPALMIYIWSLNKNDRWFKTEVALDCQGEITCLNGMIQAIVAEIKTSEAGYAKAVNQLVLRLVVLGNVLSIVEKGNICLIGHIYTAKKLRNPKRYVKRLGDKEILIVDFDAVLSSKVSAAEEDESDNLKGRKRNLKVPRARRRRTASDPLEVDKEAILGDFGGLLETPGDSVDDASLPSNKLSFGTHSGPHLSSINVASATEAVETSKFALVLTTTLVRALSAEPGCEKPSGPQKQSADPLLPHVPARFLCVHPVRYYIAHTHISFIDFQ